MSRFTDCLPLLLEHEGGWTDNPHDPGGATNLGVTLATLSAWRGHPCTKADVQALTPDAVAPIYRTEFWTAAACDLLPPGLDYWTFDFAVNSGPGRAKRYLQEAAGVTVDGSVGPATLGAVAAAGAKVMIVRLDAAREAFYRADKEFSTFGKGWLRRLNEVTAQALGMIAAP